MPLVEMRTVTITRKGQIVIPREVRELKGFREGAKIVVIAFDDRIELRPMKQLGEKMFTLLASEKLLAKNWLSKEDEEAWKDL